MGECCCGRVDVAEDFGCFPFDFLFFAGNVRDDVVEDVHAGDAGVAAAGDGLEGGDGDGGEAAEGVVEGFERDDETGGGAVGVGDDEAFGEVVLEALVGDHGEVGGVDEGDHEWGDGVAAVVFGIGEDDEVGVEELGLWGGVSRGVKTAGGIKTQDGGVSRQ